MAQGGLGSYVYTLQDTSGTDITPAPTQTSPGVFVDLSIGTYQVEVESGDCLTTSAQIPITEPSAPLTANFVASNVTCPGSNNGMLEISASGGTGIIKYAISPRLDQFFETFTSSKQLTDDEQKHLTPKQYSCGHRGCRPVSAPTTGCPCPITRIQD